MPGRGGEFQARLRGSNVGGVAQLEADAAPGDDQLESSPKAKTHVLHTTTTMTERAKRGGEGKHERASESEYLASY